VQPVQLAQSRQAMHPAQSIQSAHPMQSTQPAHPAQSMQPMQSTQPASSSALQRASASAWLASLHERLPRGDTLDS
jgi:hypothetical protein